MRAKTAINLAFTLPSTLDVAGNIRFTPDGLISKTGYKSSAHRVGVGVVMWERRDRPLLSHCALNLQDANVAEPPAARTPARRSLPLQPGTLLPRRRSVRHSH